jgi:hypothetical protein
MKVLLGATTSLAILCVVLVQGQETLTGAWEGETGQGRLIALEIKADGGQLTGTLTVDRRTATISDGKVTGKMFSFKASLDGDTRAFTGELVGDEIRLIVEGARSPATLRRPAFTPPTTREGQKE